MTFRYGGLVAALTCAAVLTACASARLEREGMQAFDHGDYEVALIKLREAAARDPDNLVYRLDVTARHEEAVQKLIADGDRARTAGDPASAESAYHRVLTLESGNERAQRGLDGVAADRRHAETAARAQQELQRGNLDQAEALLAGVLNEDPGYGPATALRTRINAARGPVSASPKLRTRDNRPVTLQFRDAPTKAVFEVLSRQTGINFVFDKDVRSDTKTTIFVQEVPVEQAIDLVLSQNQLARQVLSDNMVMIYPNTTTKQKDYQDQVVRTFYLTTAAPKEVEGLIKTVLDAKTMVINERSGTVTIRDTPEVIRMAERLVASIDLPDPEVMLEVEVLEIKRTRMQQLGIAYPTQATLSTPSNMVLNSLKNLNGSNISVTPLTVTVDALKQDGVSNVLASPRIRARNKEKAKILIGSRVPVITETTSLLGATSTPTTNVQYLDVGLTLNVEPTVYANDDVGIKIDMEVSSILDTVKVGGTVAYEIGTRNATTVLQLKDGETQVLAGLIQDSDTRSASKIPGLGDIPVLGRLFADHSLDKSKTEIVLSITPRIIRQRGRAAGDSIEFWYGTESRTGIAPLGATPIVAAPAPGATGRSAPVQVLPVPVYVPTDVSSTAGNGVVTGAAGSDAPVPVADNAHTVASLKAAASPQGPAPKAELMLSGPTTAHVGDEFTVSVDLRTDQPLSRLRAQVRFDSSTLQLASFDNGELAPAASGAKITSPVPGGVMLEVASATDKPIDGSGTLMVLHFKALKPRPLTALAAQLAVMNSAGAMQGSSTPAPLTLAIAGN